MVKKINNGNMILSVYVQEELLEFYKLLSQETGISVSEHGRIALEDYANKAAEYLMARSE